ncbi:MAG: flippase-like domain-containing protein [Actinobacteria bacterium]|nr:MAG: flippase-like domain-containing protein [Actinomycetota bacterium]
MRQVYGDVHEFFHAVSVFSNELASVSWTALAVALGLHLVKILLRTVAYRNIVRAAYPEENVRWAPVAGAYIVGVGVNSIVPGRAGDLVKLYLLKHRVPSAAYSTLASTLVAETLLDFVIATAFFLWALVIGVVPSIHAPAFDWEKRFGRGFAILRDRRRYAREVVSWQLASWVSRIASLYWFLKAFHIHATVHNALLAQVVDSLSTLLPISPGGAGTKQGFLVVILHGQASSARLLAFSIGMYVAVTLFNVVIGAIALFAMLRTLRLGEVLSRAKAAESKGS